MTAHSLNPVPFVLSAVRSTGRHMHDGVLADVAPTLLALVGVPLADGMTGRTPRATTDRRPVTPARGRGLRVLSCRP